MAASPLVRKASERLVGCVVAPAEQVDGSGEILTGRRAAGSPAVPGVEGINALLDRMEPFRQVVPACDAVVVAQLVARGFVRAACIVTCAVRRRGVALLRARWFAASSTCRLDVVEYASGANARLVSERLGHSSVAFTLDTYGHVLPGQQADAAAAVARLVENSVTKP